MIFNGEANNLDLYSDARWWCGLETDDTTTYPLEDFTRNANLALDKVTTKILRSDSTWSWDDTNYLGVDMAIGYKTLVANQEDYSISVTHLKYRQVRVLGADGKYHVLKAVNRRDLTDSQLNAEAGMPKFYWQVGNSIFISPKPAASAVTLAAGLELEYQRGASYFTIASTTTSPGFASQFHRLISLYSALDYCDVNDLDTRAEKIKKRIETMEAELVEFYSSRDADQVPHISVEREDYGQQGL